jgi:hypothetical protein
MLQDDPLQQPAAAMLDQVVDRVEAAGVVGVRNITGAGAWRIVEQPRDLRVAAARQSTQVGQVLAVERDEIVEAREVVRRDRSRAVAIVDAAFAQHAARTVMWRLADVPGAGAGRVSHNAIGQASLRNQVTKYGLGHRRAADVAEADEQDADN